MPAQPVVRRAGILCLQVSTSFELNGRFTVDGGPASVDHDKMNCRSECPIGRALSGSV
jgi:hypothetical protein